MAKRTSGRLATAEDLRRFGNCFVWTGSAAQAAFGKRPKPAPEAALGKTDETPPDPDAKPKP